MDWITSSLINLAISIVEIFPTSPFVILDELSSTEIYSWIQMLNWFIPVTSFVGILETWLSCVAVYYVYQVVLRWIKVIE